MKKIIDRSLFVALILFSCAAFQQLSYGADSAQSTHETATPPRTGKETKKLDLNSATKAELQSLPGIGAASADAIIAARPFWKVEDLKNVQGIGDTKFAQIKSKVTVKRSTSTATTQESTGHQKSSASTSRSPASAKIDLNSARREELATLPGIGAATADAIIAARPFKTIEDLKAVKGIGDAKYQQIRPLVTVHSNRNPSVGAAPGGTRGSSQAPDTTQRTLGTSASQKAKGETAPPSANSSRSTSNHTKININSASEEELESLLGIGPVKAQAIIDHRPYTSIEDLMNVKGIKEGTFDQIKDNVTVR